MADFVTHGLFSGGFYGIIARWLSRKPWVIWIAFSCGVVAGIWPDAGSWLIGQLGGSEGYWYHLYHFDPPLLWVMQPGFLFHFLLDKIFHSGPPNWLWWPSLWWLEVLMWIASGVMIFFTFWKLHDTSDTRPR